MSKKISGHYHQTDHGPEIFPRRRTFTSEEHRWRKAVVGFVWEHLKKITTPISSTVVLRESQVNYQVTSSSSYKEEKKQQKRNLREQLTDILLTLRVVNEILKVQYGSPDWGNQPHVIDELVYILLTRRSKIEDASRHLSAIQEKYTAWEDVAFAPPDELKAVIMGGGLEDEKVKNIQSSLQVIYQEFGRINEADFTDMSGDQLNKFLLELPGVGPKSSACVLMYARDADVFPADTHCIRILNRLGLFIPFGFEWDQTNHKQAEKDLLLLVPPHMRSNLHRNLLALGREICKKTPLCDRCELKKFCAYYRQQQQAKRAALDTPTAIDMFCGAGGFSLGLSRAGFKVASELQPRYVVIENVPGLGSAEIEEKSYADHIGEQLEALEYQVEVIRLEAFNFGIPQKRHRYFILGVCQEEKKLDLEALENTVLPEDKRTKLKHALYDLPRLSVSDGSWIMAHTNGLSQDAELYKQYLRDFKIRGNSCILFNHVSRFNNEDDVELYSNLEQGETYRQLVERLTAEFGETPYFTKYSTKNFHDKYYRLVWDSQSKTIVSHLHKDGNSFVHPTQTRSISVREAARIQSFPDDYIFCGSRGPQFIQIGNAVPPVMAL